MNKEARGVALLTNRVLCGIDTIMEHYLEEATGEVDRKIRELIADQANIALSKVSVETHPDEYIIRIGRPFNSTGQS